MRANKIEHISETQIEQFENMGLPWYLQNHLMEHIQLTNGVQIVDYIQMELGKKIELSEEYIAYRNTLWKYKFQKRNENSGQITLYNTVTALFNILLITIMANLLR